MESSTRKIVLNSIATGIVAMVATKYLLGEYQNVVYYGMPMSASMANGIGCASGSLVSDLTSDYVIKNLAITNQMMNGATMATKISIGAVSSAGLLYFGGMPSEGIPTALIIGGASKLGGDYANENIVGSRGFISL